MSTIVRGDDAANFMVAPTTGGYLLGNGGNDTLNGDVGDDLFAGGADDDLLIGKGGRDIYYGATNAGNDVINNDQSTPADDRLVFGSTVSASNLKFYRDGNDLLIGFTGDSYVNADNSIRILNQFAGANYQLNFIEVGSPVGTPYLDINPSSLKMTLYGMGTAAADTLQGYEGYDIITAADGNDSVYGNGGNDNLDGGTGNDLLDGGLGVDTLIGGMGNDSLYGGVGDDLLTGGVGDDLLTGGEGADRYIYTLGDGQDTINNLQTTVASHKIVFGAGISLATLQLSQDGNDLVLTFSNSSNDSIRIAGQFSGSATRLVSAQFSDASTVILPSSGSGLALYSAGTRGNDTLIGDAANNTLQGGAGADSLQGGAGNDTLQGGTGADQLKGDAGNDLLTGNTGDDQLQGGEGADSYSYGLGDGQDTVNNFQTTVAAEKIVLGAGITAGVVQLYKDGNDLLIRFSNSTSDSIRVLNQFGSDSRYTLNTLVFSDATTLNINPLTYSGTFLSSGELHGDVLQGSAVRDLMNGNGGDDQLYGNAGIDTLYGGAGNDTLLGGAGNDQLYGGTGTDTLLGGDGNDVIDGGSNADLMQGQAGNDSYYVDSIYDQVAESANQGLDTVFANVSYTLGDNVENLTQGGSGNETGTGNALGNFMFSYGSRTTLNGLAGNDTLEGGYLDTLAGGVGDDVYLVNASTVVTTEVSGEGVDLVQSMANYTLGLNVENLTLTGANINGTGNDMANIITGSSGDNILDGGFGVDTLIGGLGNDTYIINTSQDVIVENANSGIDGVQSYVSYALQDNIENLTIRYGADYATGNALNNVITSFGVAYDNVLDGGIGADTMQGGGGNDRYAVDNIGDLVVEHVGEGVDTVESSISYTLTINVENLTLTGSSAVLATGNELANVLTGNSANNILDGLAGNDTLSGGLGNDIYKVDNSADVVIEGAAAGTDTIFSTTSYTLGANVENLTLTDFGANTATGNALDNVLIGNISNNVLVGGAGNDTLNGGESADNMSGGDGNDTYYIDDSGDIVTEAAAAGTDTAISSLSYKLTANVENLTLTGTGTRNGIGNDLANYIVGNYGNNTLTGGKGNDTYNLGRTSLHDTLVESDSTIGNKDTLRFAADVHYDQLWFKKVGNDLIVDIIGTTSSATVKSFFFSSANHIEVFRAGDGKVLTDSHVQNLVNAMASMTEPGIGQTTLTPAQATSLAPVFTANWT